MEENIENEINHTLNSLEGLERAAIPPFFFTRLEARMLKEKSFWEKSLRFFTNPAWAFGSICLLLFLNIFVISFSANTRTLNVAQQQSTDFTTIDEYSQVSASLFDFENSKP